jgi:hypothetical protein
LLSAKSTARHYADGYARQAAGVFEVVSVCNGLSPTPPPLPFFTLFEKGLNPAGPGSRDFCGSQRELRGGRVEALKAGLSTHSTFQRFNPLPLFNHLDQ